MTPESLEFPQSFEALVEAVASGRITTPEPFDVKDDAALDALIASFAKPRPYAQAEAVEAWIKQSWLHAGANNLDAATRARFTEFFLHIGFIPKYKAYGVKYATPFGYALFDLEDGEGFSVQLHETAKVEAFHVIGTSPNAFILLCDEADWEANGPEMIEFWKAGKPEESSLVHRPVAGDVAVIEDLSTVHTVTGCLVEEFATTSYDAVKRLYDQNEGRPSPLPAQHRKMADVLAAAQTLGPKRYVKREGSEWKATEIAAGNTTITGLAEKGLVGSHIIVCESPVESTIGTTVVSTLFVLTGNVLLDVDGTEFELTTGDTTALAPGSSYKLTSVGGESRLSVCEVATEFGFADLR